MNNTILIVDDSKHVRRQIEFVLKSKGYKNLLHAESADEAFKCLKGKQEVALILMDIEMPQTDGIKASLQIKENKDLRDVQIIMVTGRSDPESLQSAFSAGAVDYVTKPINHVELVARVRSVLKLKAEMDRRKARETELLELTRELKALNQKLDEANHSLYRLSFSDGLTGIANRRYFDEVLEKEWTRAARHTRTISLIMLDIDFFKAYNDTYGHQQGDECLKNVARALSDALKRPNDIAARYGGEEFAILMPETDTEGSLTIAKRIASILASLGVEHRASQVSDYVSVSMGISSVTPQKISSSQSLIAGADKALYQAKQQGRNRIEIFNYQT